MGTRVVQRQIRLSREGLRGLDQRDRQGWRQGTLTQGQNAVPSSARMQAEHAVRVEGELHLVAVVPGTGCGDDGEQGRIPQPAQAGPDCRAQRFPWPATGRRSQRAARYSRRSPARSAHSAVSLVRVKLSQLRQHPPPHAAAAPVARAHAPFRPALRLKQTPRALGAGPPPRPRRPGGRRSRHSSSPGRGWGLCGQGR